MIKHKEDREIPGLATLAQQVIAMAILDLTVHPTTPEEEENKQSALMFLTGDGDPEGEQTPFYVFWASIMGPPYMVPNPEILNVFIKHSGKKSMKAAIGGRL